jgi:hypothetical protein
VAHRGALGVVPAARPDELLDLGVEHRLHHGHPGGDTHRQQALPGHRGDIAEHLGQLRRQLRTHVGRVGIGDQAQVRYVLLHGGPSLLGLNVVFHPNYHSALQRPWVHREAA